MQTASLSKTVRLSNEELGSLQRRVHEIVRRVEEGTVPLEEAMTGLQRIIERSQLPQVRYAERARPLAFEHLPRAERRKSRARLSIRLAHSLVRLRYPQRNPERIIAELWEIECIPCDQVNYGRTPVEAIMGEGSRPTRDQIAIINSTIQWLGTNVGQTFLQKFLRVSQMYIG